MKPDNFDLHIYSNNITYYHEHLMNLIDSVTEKDKSELEKLAKELSKKLGIIQKEKQINLVFGYYLGDQYINNILGHVSLDYLRMSFDLNPIDLHCGSLKYNDHNVGTHDNIKGALYSILLKYISTLNKYTIKKL